MSIMMVYLPAEERSDTLIGHVVRSKFSCRVSSSLDELISIGRSWEKDIREANLRQNLQNPVSGQIVVPPPGFGWIQTVPLQGAFFPPIEYAVKEEEPECEEETREQSIARAGQAVSPRGSPEQLKSPIATENSQKVVDRQDMAQSLPKSDEAAVVQKESDSGIQESLENGGGGVSRGKKRVQLEDAVSPDFGGIDDDCGGLDEPEDQPSFDQNLKTTRKEGPPPSQRQEIAGFMNNGVSDQSIGDGSGGEEEAMSGGSQNQKKRRIEIQDEDGDYWNMLMTLERRRNNRSVVPTKFYGVRVADDLRKAFETNKFPKCPVAGCVQDFKEDLVQHMKGHAKPHVCRFCPYRSAKPYDLRTHYRSHTKERPFPCVTCGKTFSRPYCLKTHQAIHEGVASHALLPSRED